MNLNWIVKTIKKQQQKMGYENYINFSKENQLQYMRDISLALTKEVSEFLDEIPWKPWNSIDTQSEDIEAAALELCDIIVFTLVLYITLDPDMPLEKAMEQTLTKINKRIKSGYTGQKECK